MPLVIDKLKSYAAAKKQVLKGVEHRYSQGIEQLAENSHQSTRVRERRMRKFKSPGQTQRFLSAFSPIRDHFYLKQHQLTAIALSPTIPSTISRLARSHSC
ncbi:hypothetical protein C7B80_10835 [Cyanosarcina cf. burmensis CCALA 770]|nr:hypothetical protein C7B80_10835 [Cyanosarcina cf. burmensis CCALA 770]